MKSDRTEAPRAAPPPAPPQLAAGDTLATGRPPPGAGRPPIDLRPDDLAAGDTLAAGRPPPGAGRPPIDLRPDDLAASETLAASGPPAAPSPHVLPRGTALNRYLVLDRLGAGGMGVVYAAFDPELDRRIALKLVRADVGGATTDRLLREAQAMAKLAHPSVVTVHDVGVADGQVFLAMELIRGGTLTTWLSRQPRSWPEILAVFADAGRGLAAAHQAGLVHRDFKPDNVLVGDDGRVVVTDFGLARVDAEATHAAAPIADTGTSTSARAAPVTHAGAIVGTPAYMAPEQHQGRPTDARSDLFAFCVALWEALFGARPFAGETYGELVHNVLAGAITPPPAGADAPPWLRRALLRGLAVDPAERWPSMAELLAVIDRHRQRAWRTWWLAGTLVAVAIAIALGASFAEYREQERCRAAAAPLAELWSPARRAQLRAALLATGVGHAADTWRRVEPLVDTWAGRWNLSKTTACHEEASDPLADARARCLDERLGHLRGLVDELAAADEAVAAAAVRAAASLPPIEVCADPHWLAAAFAPLADPARAAEVQALRARLAHASARERAGHFTTGLQEARAVLDEATRLDYPPLVAEAHLAVGRLHARLADHVAARDALLSAYFLAGAIGHEAVAAAAAIALVRVHGIGLYQRDAGLEWSRHARMVLDRAGPRDGGLAESERLANLGTLLAAHAMIPEGQARIDEAIALRRPFGDDPDLGLLLLDAGRASVIAGNFDEAHTLLTQAEAILARTEGPEHPDVAMALNWLGNAASGQSRFDDALVHYQRSREIRERALGPEHPDVAASLNNIGVLMLRQGRRGDAIDFHRRALGVRERALPPDHPDLAASRSNLGSVLHRLDRDDEAEPLLRAALAAWERVLGPEHPSLAYALVQLGDIARLRGDTEPALALLERALRLRAGAQAADRAEPLALLACARWEHDRPRAEADARAAAELLDAAGLADDAAALRRWLEPGGPGPERRCLAP